MEKKYAEVGHWVAIQFDGTNYEEVNKWVHERVAYWNFSTMPGVPSRVVGLVYEPEWKQTRIAIRYEDEKCDSLTVMIYPVRSYRRSAICEPRVLAAGDWVVALSVREGALLPDFCLSGCDEWFRTTFREEPT